MRITLVLLGLLFVVLTAPLSQAQTKIDLEAEKDLAYLVEAQETLAEMLKLDKSKITFFKGKKRYLGKRVSVSNQEILNARVFLESWIETTIDLILDIKLEPRFPIHYVSIWFGTENPGTQSFTGFSRFTSLSSTKINQGLGIRIPIKNSPESYQDQFEESLEDLYTKLIHAYPLFTKFTYRFHYYLEDQMEKERENPAHIALWHAEGAAAPRTPDIGKRLSKLLEQTMALNPYDDLDPSSYEQVTTPTRAEIYEDISLLIESLPANLPAFDEIPRDTVFSIPLWPWNPQPLNIIFRYDPSDSDNRTKISFRIETFGTNPFRSNRRWEWALPEFRYNLEFDPKLEKPPFVWFAVTDQSIRDREELKDYPKKVVYGGGFFVINENHIRFNPEEWIVRGETVGSASGIERAPSRTFEDQSDKDGEALNALVQRLTERL